MQAPPTRDGPRVNEEIRVPQVRLIDAEGEMMGVMGARDAMLRAYAVGLAAFSAVRVMVPAFYSLGMARIPVTISMITIAVTVGLYFLLIGPLQHAGLALATSIGSVLNFAPSFCRSA